MSTRSLKIAALYPELLSIYADRGNLAVLKKRCQWRGLDCEIDAITIGDDLDSDRYNMIYLGGGQDRDQQLCADDLLKNKCAAIEALVERDAVVLAVCGGYQLLGNSYQMGERSLKGLRLVDVETVREDGKRLIGNAMITPTFCGDTANVLAGFENHAGRTYLAAGLKPLGTVISGFGNNGDDAGEGVIAGPSENIIGTYLHGPLLPKNSWFADWLIAKALQIRSEELAPLDDRLELAAHKCASVAARPKSRRSRSRSLSALFRR